MNTSKISDVNVSATMGFHDGILEDKQSLTASSVAPKYRGTMTDQKDMMVSRITLVCIGPSEDIWLIGVNVRH